MSDFEFDFEFAPTNANGNAAGGGDRKVTDWDALNAHIIEAAGTGAKARSIPGIISGLIDLGIQERGMKEVVSKVPRDKEAEHLEKYPDSEFFDGLDENGNEARMMRYMQKPCQQVVLMVDFNNIIVDKGLHITGNSNPLPYRMSLCGDFTLKGAGPEGKNLKIVGKPYTVREVKHDDGTWALAKNNGLHKLADACGVLNDKGYFTKEMLGKLIGKVAQFQIRAYMKPGNGGKSFFTEDIKLVGMVPEGVPLPEVKREQLFGINMYPKSGANDPEAVKVLRAEIKNTIKRANNYDGSPLQKELEALEGSRSGGGGSQPAPQEKKAEGLAPSGPAPSDDDGFDEDVPF